ncbi:HAMP domain-containing sensor histidine kinase [Caballeronia sp. LZ001]|uniref:sensor histidine kinase n=1 Tax=Caballeronia sp. LZ001 TaxID=3038553 RepID=UPI00285614ED|nr:HAMP domain-containing sensor histidine kinase [Caballeronia sp. LZ001]MDR5806399.1 HAMP domain-containing sensor histidine kinase [Caballeronia sp. LZ001]
MHANDRLSQGFGINALVAEFRALRASVLRRWQDHGPLDAAAFEQMIRFNEAIDQMLAESVGQFAARTERLRDMFAGILAHDLRSPVGAIMASTYSILRDEHLSPTSLRAGANLQRSAERVKTMIDDLFVYTRTRLGDKLPIDPTQQDFGRICRNAVDEVQSACPNAQIELEATGELGGFWDGAKLSQLIVNLLTNAVNHGSGSICLSVGGDDHQVVLKVANEGSPIPADALPTLFDPLTRASASREQKRSNRQDWCTRIGRRDQAASD